MVGNDGASAWIGAKMIPPCHQRMSTPMRLGRVGHRGARPHRSSSWQRLWLSDASERVWISFLIERANGSCSSQPFIIIRHRAGGRSVERRRHGAAAVATVLWCDGVVIQVLEEVETE